MQLRIFDHIDVQTLFAGLVLLALVVLSLLGQKSAVSYIGGESYDKQTMWMIISLVVFVVCVFVDLRLVERFSFGFFFVCLFLLVLTKLFGTSVNGSKRWLSLGGANLQASEFAKLAMLLALARLLHRDREHKPGESPPRRGLYPLSELYKPLFVILAPIPLILTQPDLGTSLLIMIVGLTVLLVEGVQKKIVAVGLLVILIGVPLAWNTGFIREYQQDRVWRLFDSNWEKVDTDSGSINKRLNSQVEQAELAIGTGGLTGEGFSDGAQERLRYLPEVETDFIIAMLAEEMGFVGIVLLLVLFWWLVVWALSVAVGASTRFGRIFAVGLSAIIAWQVFINVGMVSGFLPVVGLPLPMLSYGGSALLTLMAAFGLLFNVARTRGRI